MTAPLVRMETVEKTILSTLQEGEASALAAEAAHWTSEGDPLPLASFAEWLEGRFVTVLEWTRAKFPAASVLVMEQVPDQDLDQFGYLVATMTAQVYWYVAADTETECNKLCKRYGQALMSILAASPQLAAGIALRGAVPRVQVSEMMRHFPSANGLGVEMTGDEFFVQVGRATYELQVD